MSMLQIQVYIGRGNEFLSNVSFYVISLLNMVMLIGIFIAIKIFMMFLYFELIPILDCVRARTNCGQFKQKYLMQFNL